jgi:hypothetical protein
MKMYKLSVIEMAWNNASKMKKNEKKIRWINSEKKPDLMASFSLTFSVFKF